MTTIHTTHGVYTGRSLGSIVRREYGRRAVVTWAADPNDPNAGMITEAAPTDPGASNVLATLHWVEEDGATPDTDLADATAAVRDARGDLDTALAAQAQAIRADRAKGQSGTGLDRSRIYQILA